MKNLKELRQESGMTQEQMAIKLNVEQATYSRWENGKINIPIEQLKKMAEMFNVSVDFILER